MIVLLPPADRQNPRKIFLVSLFALARLWLLSLLFYRAQKRCGDSRFDKIKPFFFKYLVAWVLQGIWCFFIAAPLFVVNGSRRNVPLNGVDYFLIAGMASSIMLEVVADVTKFRWVSSGRPGGFCDVGVWRWSRHPNYFAEIAMWWFAWALTLRLTTSTGEESPSVDWGWSLFALLSPLTTMGLLLFVSGLPLCEGAALKRYLNVPGFQEYRENTSILVPIPKGIWKVLPMWVRRCVFCELRRYEYREGGKNAAGAVGGGAG